MNKPIRLFVVCLISCMFLSACSNFNPLAPPDLHSIENNEMEDDSSQIEIPENIDDMLKENEKLTEDKSADYSNKFIDKTESIYYKAFDKYLSNNQKRDKDEPFVKSLLIRFYSIYNNIRIASPIIIIVSIVFGVIGILFSRYNKGARRFFLVAFVICIPLLVLFIVFGIGVLNSIFIYD